MYTDITEKSMPNMLYEMVKDQNIILTLWLVFQGGFCYIHFLALFIHIIIF
jgi:hypothetical protein